MRILIADDDAASRRLLRRVLCFHGKCDIFENGQELKAAYDFAVERSDYYDLIIMDLIMPTVSGKEILQYIRETESRKSIKKIAKIIIISGYYDLEKLSEKYNAYWIEKPVDIAFLNLFVKNLFKDAIN